MIVYLCLFYPHFSSQEETSQQQDPVSAFPNGVHPQLLSRRQSLETQYLQHRLQVRQRHGGSAAFGTVQPTGLRVAAGLSERKGGKKNKVAGYPLVKQAQLKMHLRLAPAAFPLSPLLIWCLQEEL